MELYDLLRVELQKKPNLQNLFHFSRKVDEAIKQKSYPSYFIQKRLAVLGGYNTNFLVPLIRTFAYSKGIALEAWECEYGRLDYFVLSNPQTLSDFKPDLVYLCVGSEHIRHENPLDEIARWKSLWDQLEFLKCDIVQNNFLESKHRVYGNFELKFTKSQGHQIRELNTLLLKNCPSHVQIFDANYLSSFYGLNQWLNERDYDLTKSPVSQSHLPYFANHFSNLIAALWGRSKKCLVLDLDHTLWGGTLGDDGPSNLIYGEETSLGQAYMRFQKFLKNLKERGILLAVASKNDERNVRECFEARSDFALKMQDFSCMICNWGPKSQSVLEISKRLNIGLDSIVFLDDSPFERALVKKSLPTVEVPEPPEDVAYYTSFLSNLSLFETTQITEEDLRRTESFVADRKRQDVQSQLTSYEDFLKELQMEALVQPLDETSISRVHQLFQKTNQFNTTNIRFSESELRSLMKDPESLCLFGKVWDRFGDYGIVSALIATPDLTESEKTIEIKNWVMSCRVFDRGIEKLFISELMARAQEKGYQWLKGCFVSSAKNSVIENLYSGLGFKSMQTEKISSPKVWKIELANEPSKHPGMQHFIRIRK